MNGIRMKFKIISFYIHSYGFWFRILGYGLAKELASKSPKLFSERNGYVKAWYIFGLKIKYLKKDL